MRKRDADDSPPSVSRNRLVIRVDEELFAAWKGRDPAAQTEAWRRLWTATYSWAVPFCKLMAPDALSAEEWAAEAIVSAIAEIEKLLAKGFYWQGEPQFAAVFAMRVKDRCRDRCRASRREALRAGGPTSDEDAAAGPENGLLGSGTPELEAIDIARTREALDEIVCRLASWGELCAGRAALVEVIEATLEYLRECCVRAVGGVEAAAVTRLTLDELVPLLDRREFEASSKEKNAFVMTRLQIDRATLDNRLREIRKAVPNAEAGARVRPGEVVG